MQTTVSIVVPCRRERQHIERCLQSILAQDEPLGGMEIIVADGMSEDGTREALRRLASLDSRLRVIDNPRRSAAAGLNTAIRCARGEVIIRMDAHTTYARDYVSQCLEVLAASGADNVGGPARTMSTTYMQEAICAAYHSPFSVGGASFHKTAYEGEVDTVTYGCWRRSVFDRIGLFDEGVGPNEDDEFNLRLVRSGGRIWQSPRIRSWYAPRSTLSTLFRQYMQYGYWKVRVIQKHNYPASVRHLVPGAFVLAVIFLLAASAWWPQAFAAWVAVLAVYAICATLASCAAAARSSWRLLPVLPPVFACYHCGYGWGFLRGLLDFLVLRRSPPVSVAEVTRPIVRNPLKLGELFPGPKRRTRRRRV